MATVVGAIETKRVVVALNLCVWRHGVWGKARAAERALSLSVSLARSHALDNGDGASGGRTRGGVGVPGWVPSGCGLREGGE